MSSLALSFNDVNFDAIHQNGCLWLKTSELAKALGYVDQSSVTRIYSRNEDEFSKAMSCSVKLTEKGQTREVRVFSLRGCHLIAMFARTPVAKEFRKWVLDVLDKEVLQQQIDTRVKINAEQQAELKEIVDRRCEGNATIRAELWSKHNKHFRIPRYNELLAIHFQDPVDYLETLEIKVKGEIHIDDNQSIEILCIHAKLFQAWWKTHSPTLGKLNPTLESILHDNMFYMTTAITNLCKKYELKLPDYDYEHMFELNKLPHQRYLLLK